MVGELWPLARGRAKLIYPAPVPTLEREEITWYHTLELPDGETDGWFDLRPYVHHYGLPERMDGMRALDVGTWDGFWAFEMERRGAEVVALDLDDEADLDWLPRRRPESFPTEPRGAGFRIAHQRLDSKVERVNLSIYDALPEQLGQFDVVFCGSVLIHLRDQLLAMERIANLCRGVFISAEEYDRVANLIPIAVSRFRGHGHGTVVYWRPNVKTWNRMLWTAGFDEVEQVTKFKMKSRDGFSVPHVVFHCRPGS
jgi:tRNA (mo5U34)-methyltransferase